MSRANGTARVPPAAPDAEASLLGALLLSADNIAAVEASGLEAADFYKPAHQFVYDVVRTLAAKSPDAGADVVTVVEELRRVDLLELVGGAEAVYALQTDVPSVNVARYLGPVQEAAARRRLIALAAELTAGAYGDAELATLVEQTRTDLDRVPQRLATTSALPKSLDWTELLTTTVEEEWLVDDFWPARRAISIAAQYKKGKSLLTFYVAGCLARGTDPWTLRKRRPVPVGYFDLEMTEDDVRERALDFGFQPADLAHFHYYLLPSLPPLDTAEGGRAVLEILQRDGVAAAVFDTFGRVVEGEENVADTIAAYNRHTANHLKAAGIASARLDHVGHGNQDRARGSSSKGADVDVAWVLTRGEDRTSTLDHHGVSRIRWVPRRLDLVLLEGPPDRFARTEATWPAGSREYAAILDELGVPVDAGERPAGKALRDAGHKVASDLVRAAIRWRRESAPEHTR